MLQRAETLQPLHTSDMGKIPMMRYPFKMGLSQPN